MATGSLMNSAEARVVPRVATLLDEHTEQDATLGVIAA